MIDFLVVLPAALRAVAPTLTDGDVADWTLILPGPMRAHSIVTARQVAGFLGQCAVETGGFTELEENCDYSAGRMMAVWPSRFPTLAQALPLDHQPQAIANHVYADRMGNGSEASGDGWLFRGRGLIQTTGRDSYARYAGAIQASPAIAAAWMATREGAADVAAWDWQDMGCGSLAEAWDLRGLSLRINGGTVGLGDRIRLCTAALRAVLAAGMADAPLA